MNIQRTLIALAAIGLLPVLAAAQTPLGTAFTYQGRLVKNGTPVTSPAPHCNCTFGLWDAAAGGDQKGNSPQAVNGVAVTNGLFTVNIDFGANGMDGTARWLEIAVQCPGDGAATTLAPRQELKPSPHALALPGLYTRQNATSPNIIGGYSANSVSTGVVAATISGGGEDLLINRVTDNGGTVGGGVYNQVGDGAGTTSDKPYATVGGGTANTASNASSTVSGGFGNSASGNGSTVGGGANNAASGRHSTVSGGFSNTAGGEWSFAAGHRAKVRAAADVGGGDSDGDEGTFVWADSTDADFQSTGPNQFLIRATGGVGIGTNNPTEKLEVAGKIKASANVATPGSIVRAINDGNGAAIQAIANSNAGEAAVKIFNTGTGYTLFTSATVPPGTMGYLGTRNVVTVGPPPQPGQSERAPEISTEQFATGGGADFAAQSPAVCPRQPDRAAGGGGEDLLVVGRIVDADDIGIWTAVGCSGGHAVQAHAREGIAVYGSTNFAGFPDGAMFSNPNAIGIKGFSYDGVALAGESPNGTAGQFIGDLEVLGDAHVSGAMSLGTTATAHPLQVGTDPTNGNGAHVTAGGVWTNGSDRNSKQSFEEVDKQEILRRVAELPVSRWQYKGESESVRHIGPMAQDFYAAFETGADERYIGTIDADGVALAAIQGLYQVVQEKECEISDLRERNTGLLRMNDELAARLARIEELLGAGLLSTKEGVR